MRLDAVIFAAMLWTTPLLAQQAGTSTDPATRAPTAESSPAAESPQTAESPQAAEAAKTKDAELPVSLGRIREGLARSPQSTTLKDLDLKADFIILVEEQDHLQTILSKLDFSGGPAPAGGLYGYEQQQRAFSKTERPLQQPYAAFSGGELLTLAIEGLVQKYLGGALVNAVTGAQRSRAEREARAEVATAIAAYCDAQPDGGRALHLCQDVVDR